MEIFVVDAFTKEPFKGNPAAVTIVEDFPSDERCLNISSEMNLSETVFVKPLGKNRFHLRWFNPAMEIKLCGHATLAASHILFEKGMVDPQETIEFDSLSGPLFVMKTDQGITLDFPLQKTGKTSDHTLFANLLKASILNVVEVCGDVIVELEDEQAVRSLQVNPQSLKEFDFRGLIVTSKGSDKYDCVSRFFAPRVGVDEDPVTGSAHCKLAHYWMEKLGKKTLYAYQASKRGGELLLNVEGDRVKISGQAVTVLIGKMLI